MHLLHPQKKVHLKNNFDKRNAPHGFHAVHFFSIEWDTCF